MTSKSLRLWFAAGAAVVLAAGGAAGVGRREPVCERSAEATRPLDLQSSDDRLHLQNDLEEITAASIVFATAVSRRPALSDSIDAQAGAATAPARARAWCEATLEVQLASVHQLPIGQVRAFGDGGVDGRFVEADADRSSGRSALSSVVSRPTR
jgi:hypothetical protein